MQFKRIEDFTFDDCKNFLDSNPSGEQADMVRARLNQLLQEQRNQRIRAEEARKNRISDLERNSVKWIDFNQFMEGKKYRSYLLPRIIFGTILILCLVGVIATAYYTNNSFHIYSEWDQEDYTTGIECFLLKFGAITPPHYFGYDWETGHSNEFTPGYYEYRIADGGFAFITIGAFMLLLSLIFYCLSSPVIHKVYNIEDSTEKTKFRAAQNRNGKEGLLKVGKVRLSTALPMKYDAIFPVGAAYVVKENDKYGLFSVELKKLVVPIEYDSITSYDNDTITLSKNGVDQTFSFKGYRLVP